MKKRKRKIKSLFSDQDKSLISEHTLFRGADMTRLLDYLGSEGGRRRRDISDLMEIMDYSHISHFEQLRTSKRYISYPQILKIAYWAELDEDVLMHVIFRARKPKFININYDATQIDISEVCRSYGVELSELKYVFGNNSNDKIYKIKRGERHLTFVEAYKLSLLINIDFSDLLSASGFRPYTW